MKRVVSLMLAGMLAMGLVACGEKENEIDEEKLTNVPLISSTPETPKTTDVTETEPVVILEPETDLDPYECLVLDEAECRNQGGVYIRRNDKNYKLGGWVSVEHSLRYGIGSRPNPTMQIAALYFRCGNLDIVSMGDVPVMTLEEGDRVICYGTYYLSLVSVSASRASLRATSDGSQWTIWPATGSEEYAKFSSGFKQLQIEDQYGRVLPDFTPNDLEFGKRYTVSWFEYGTNYREYNGVADSYYYESSYGDPDYRTYEFEGSLDKNGFAEFDLSEVEPGLYRIDYGFDSSTGGLINIG